jgi:hypothetical protein
MSDTRFLSLHIESTGKQVLIAANKILYMQEYTSGTLIYIRDSHSILVRETVAQIEEAFH